MSGAAGAISSGGGNISTKDVIIIIGGVFGFLGLVTIIQLLTKGAQS